MTLALDFTPNAVHAPIYAAVRKGYDRDHGIRLRIRPPGSAPDALKLLAGGRADVAGLHIPHPGPPRGRGRGLVGGGGPGERPPAAVITPPGDPRPPRPQGGRGGG